MSSPIIPFPDRRAAQGTEEESVLRSAADQMVDRATAEPVPERLIALATELGQALDARQAELGDPKK